MKTAFCGLMVSMKILDGPEHCSTGPSRILNYSRSSVKKILILWNMTDARIYGTASKETKA